VRIHHLQHVPFEGLGSIEAVLKGKGHELTCTHLYAEQPLPAVGDIDWLIIMGGPMGVYDEPIHPWLRTAKRFIKKAIEQGKTVVGICLGAQLIAEVLGAEVSKNRFREIGWFKITRSPEVEGTILASSIPEQLEVFHWHGDTFSIPQGARAIAASDACKNQGFIMDDRIVGFQFHLETTLQSAVALIENCRGELDGSKYVQSEDEILADHQKFTDINRVMSSVLKALERQNA